MHKHRLWPSMQRIQKSSWWYSNYYCFKLCWIHNLMWRAVFIVRRRKPQSPRWGYALFSSFISHSWTRKSLVAMKWKYEGHVESNWFYLTGLIMGLNMLNHYWLATAWFSRRAIQLAEIQRKHWTATFLSFEKNQGRPWHHWKANS